MGATAACHFTGARSRGSGVGAASKLRRALPSELISLALALVLALVLLLALALVLALGLVRAVLQLLLLHGLAWAIQLRLGPQRLAVASLLRFLLLLRLLALSLLLALLVLVLVLLARLRRRSRRPRGRTVRLSPLLALASL